ncbi:hypothetical protein TNCV_1282571 [Trichonephila clavipes]|uniref:Uncharacterized protein n=1 Tax=Trichonephila clavipes TaxID=2585209 RepID=A0A8X6VPF7_TRICX|nr:hypothetical protein TNCV_1282571 [Trichonephila clavipes]
MLPSLRFRRPYRQLNDFERGRIVGMRETRWPYQAICRHMQRTQLCKGAGSNGCCKELFDEMNALEGQDKPQMLDHLEDNIRRVISDIRPQMLEKVIKNWTSRLDYIRASRGSHMPEIIFKM